MRNKTFCAYIFLGLILFGLCSVAHADRERLNRFSDLVVTGDLSGIDDIYLTNNSFIGQEPTKVNGRTTIGGGYQTSHIDGAWIGLEGDDYAGTNLGGAIIYNAGKNASSNHEFLVNNSTVATFDSGGLDVTGEISISGAATSTGVLCTKSDGDIGQCTSAVGAGGTCTCG